MAKRRTNRKLTIVFKGRNPNDPYSFLVDIDNAIRPNEVEVRVEESEFQPLAKEELETRVRRAAEKALDDRERDVQESDDIFVAISKDWSKARIENMRKREALEEWTIDAIKMGWSITVKLLSAAEKFKKIVD